MPAAAAKSKKAAGTTPFKYTRDDLNNILLIYYMIRDCIDGEPAIKGIIGSTNASSVGGAGNGGGSTTIFDSFVLSRARRYLPQPNANDLSPANTERYRAYVQRAVFYNVTARTLEGMKGQVYLIDPVVQIPSQLDIWRKNADGQGLSDIQVSKRAVNDTLAYGRCGLFVDYPKTDAAATQQQVLSGEIQPIVKVIAPWNIINWRTKKRGAKIILCMVVIRETLDDDAEDGFQLDTYEQYKVLRLDDESDEYTIQHYTDDGEEEILTPLDASGKPFKDIPFTFVGAENNDSAVDKAPLYDLATLNIAHYRNSADYEESCYQVGQPTPFITGLSEDWVKNILKGVIPLGSRAGVMLPQGAELKFLEAKPNGMPIEAMKHKEDQMVSIGAKLVIQKRVQRTATEAIVDTSSESSVLANVANNVSAGMEFAIGFAARFVGAATDKIKYRLNTSFELNRLTADDVSKIIAVWQKGALTFAEMRDSVRKSGLATVPDAEALATITKEQAEFMAQGMIPDLSAAPATASGDSSAAPNPNTDPGGHATNPATRGQ